MGEDEGTVRLNVRLPTSLHRKLQESAKAHRRSLNSEMLVMLDCGLVAAEMLGEPEQVTQRLRLLQQSIGEQLRRNENQGGVATPPIS
jgi:Arc-like DNA binding domain